ncbi:2-hydroxy-3-carboxy-6-oxo-7-methylocta-2,4- dienoate decarboxylase [Streptomyces albus]|uniref:2-amino-3-carboxymuconate-6-semialdehyde decarboxylase n=1 Tax=Streptomyces albus (strain ATCC 21838 / DSM 41398 / FERM P-419 / JCM 4703 / NBRC 107858) TaxID=1081613 RepID=A0A0B5F9X7_STRA4|nr:2-hydroxy-3-carboxy-6-oxo-7-methylocta-2,4- dienoate decarboxylase [Streptomyces albus]AOU81590.1 2-hydroxy-3-carboxy-6-oxo-7-methylocta-2,4- dienoate decarboxylase [Streptomyces albus]AYN37282.1 aminocarboxymuconate-semialdehyde decarboxylase [Streptomyces albus]
MPSFTAVDVHAHHLGPDASAAASHLDPAAPRLVVDSPGEGRIVRGGATFRTVRPALWDVGVRLGEMDRAGISHQVISPVPVTMEYACAPGSDPGYARSVNDSVVAACGASGGRLLGLGCLPLHDLDAAVAELDRCRDAGLLGVEIGTRIGDLELDAPELAPFWQACEATGSAVLVHPVLGGRGAVRRTGPPYDLGLGMLTDTALAAGALVFGGVLRTYERLRIALAHGCGAFPWAYPRLRLAAGIGGDHADWDGLVRRLYADTLVFDDEHLRLLVHRFGVERVLLGSDAPFFPEQMAKSMASVRDAAHAGVLPEGTDPSLLARNALEFLGVADRTA